MAFGIFNDEEERLLGEMDLSGLPSLEKQLKEKKVVDWLRERVTTASGNPIAYLTKAGGTGSIFAPRTEVTGDAAPMGVIKIEKVLKGLQPLFHGNRVRFLKEGKEIAKGHKGYFLSEFKNIADSFGARQGGQTYKVSLKELKPEEIFDPRELGAVDKLFEVLKKYRNIAKGSFQEASIKQGLSTGRYTTYEDQLTTTALQDLGYKGNIQTEAAESLFDTLRVFSRKNIGKLE